MNSKITTLGSLEHLVALDETDHEMKEMATLLVSAMRDWPTDCRDIFKYIEEFKEYFGDPFTFKNGRIINIVHFSTYSSWRGESGAALTEIINRSTKAYNISDFDAIVDNVLSHYERKYLLTDKGNPINDTGYAKFDIYSRTVTDIDFLHWLGIESDSREGPREQYWAIRTPLTVNISRFNIIKSIMERLVPLKDRLIAFKQAYPDLEYDLFVVIWKSDMHFYINSDTMLFLGEIGATLHSQTFEL